MSGPTTAAAALAYGHDMGARSTGRTLIGLLAFVVGAALIWLSWGPLRNLFEDYQDSDPLTYVLIGGLFLIPGIALVTAAVRIFRDGGAQ